MYNVYITYYTVLTHLLAPIHFGQYRAATATLGQDKESLRNVGLLFFEPTQYICTMNTGGGKGVP